MNARTYVLGALACMVLSLPIISSAAPTGVSTIDGTLRGCVPASAHSQRIGGFYSSCSLLTYQNATVTFAVDQQGFTIDGVNVQNLATNDVEVACGAHVGCRIAFGETQVRVSFYEDPQGVKHLRDMVELSGFVTPGPA